VTTVTDAALSESDTRARPQPSWLERVVDAVVWLRSTAGESFEATIARSLDEAFASIAREFRR